MRSAAIPVPPVPHIVFLQGMPSSFFRRVGGCLAEHGWRVTRINLCFGDWLFWHDPCARSYRGSLAHWPQWIRRFFAAERVTELMLLGEQRHYHREAVAIAQELGIGVTATDFGYLRPDWITLERDGLGGASRFPRDPGKIHEIARKATVLDRETRFRDSALQMALGDLAQNFGNLLMAPLYPRYRRSDRRPPAIPYMVASGWRLLGNRLLRKGVQAQCGRLWASQRPYYLFPLQLHFDFQILAYSPYPQMEEALEEVLVSFRNHAPAGARLAVKEHPWDPGLPNWERHVHRRARALGLEDRVWYLRGGDLDRLIAGSAGVVLVNSSSGLRALELQRPLKVLGSAVFDVPGLAYQGPLDHFWTGGQEPDPGLREDFFRALAATVQVRGVFFQEPGLTEAVLETCHRLRTGTVGTLTRRDTET